MSDEFFGCIVADMHTHSEHSHDCSCPIADMSASQKERGIAYFAVTDHCDIGQLEEVDSEQVKPESALDAKRQNEFIFGIEILSGIEIGEAIWNKKLADRIIAQIDYDVVIGSVHAVKTEFCKMPYACLVNFEALGKPLAEKYLDRYFEDVLKTVSLTDMDIMAHLTYPLRYINGKHSLGVDCRKYKGSIEKILAAIISKNIALEVNTSCLESSYDELMPEKWIIELYYKMGGRLVTLGSDAHVAENAAHCFDKAIATLKEIGFDGIYYYKGRKPYKCKIIPVKLTEQSNFYLQATAKRLI